MKLLVTGASGVLGGYVCRSLLEGGHSVTSFSRTQPMVPGVSFIPGDIFDLNLLRPACRGMDAIVHLARSTEQVLERNTTGTLRVLDAAVQESVPKLVFASSNAAVGYTYQRRPITPRYFPIDEEHPSEPQDPYGTSKLLGEMLCKSYSEGFGLQTICLRINTNWYIDREGAEIAVRSAWGRGRSVEQIWKEAYLRTIEGSETHEDWPTPGPPTPWKNLWGFTDARDGAAAFRAAVENNTIAHEVFNINGNETSSHVETDKLLKEFYPEVPVKSPLGPFESLYSNRKAVRMLGFKPRFSWRESDFAAWARSRSKVFGG